jgi:hypothetical protein
LIHGQEFTTVAGNTSHHLNKSLKNPKSSKEFPDGLKLIKSRMEDNNGCQGVKYYIEIGSVQECLKPYG